ncbi:hypothetical protein [Deinococcus sp. QL22]|uniref:hypothetical protein n=1 Tax=Deinococcus sp. QL22 TaxID=2939437 RepID=UPI002016FBCF|nr:hypothetical protein [Deinococcus sp. QL22]UQN07976.1 hypothetical protein M1R55_17920 [Deinococcus sp. QL22]
MRETQVARQVVFAGGNSHQRADDRFGIEAAEVKFTYAPEEPVKVVPLEASEVKFSYAPEQPITSTERAGIKASEVKFSYAPEPTPMTPPAVGCPCGTF